MVYFLYCWLFPNGKRYVGVTSNVAKRLSDYRIRVSHGSSLPVHAALRKYGFENCEMRVLVMGSKDFILSLEVAAIEKFQTICPGGYNVCAGGTLGPMFGRKHSSATRRKMSIAWKTRPPVSEQTREKLRVATGLRGVPESVRLNMCRAQSKRMKTVRGKRHVKRLTKQRLQYMQRRYWMYEAENSAIKEGHKLSETVYSKVSAAYIAKLCEASQRRWRNPELKAKWYQARFGKPFTTKVGS
jgi:group I intron endonuclease